MKYSFVLTVAFLLGTSALADMGSVRITGRDSATVTGPIVRLEDIATVSGQSASDDDAVIMLKRITLGDSPAPGQIAVISAEQVLERLKVAQVDLTKVGYQFPRSLSITRAGREISEDEVRAAIESRLLKDQRDAVVRSVGLKNKVMVAPGLASLEANPLGSSAPGQENFLISAVTPIGETRFRVQAVIDEWRSIPVAARSLSKGEVVSTSDVSMARMHTSSLPADAESRLTGLIGYALQTNIGAGDAFSRSKLSVPPVIISGARVSIMYRSGSIEATATGVALEAGGQDQMIRVRNEGSHKVISARVVEPGLVMVDGGAQ